MAARVKVIILEQSDARTFRYALWADVPLARQSFYANASATSAWTGATLADTTALRNGEVVERVDSVSVPEGTPLGTVRTHLQALWQSFQDRVTAKAAWSRYGTTWDGTAWTVGGVA